MTKLSARKLAIGLSLAATVVAGTAYAQQQAAPEKRGDGVTTRAQAEARAAAMFDRLDVNKDGRIDQADREARRNAMFDRLDTNKDGQISRAEFNARPQRGSGAAAQRGEGDKQRGWGGRGGGKGWGHHGMGRGAVKDGMTKAEFTAAALQRFDRMDANKDGRVTKEERQAARQAMREEWRAKRGAAAPANPAR